jgi:Cu(I)/Ag(I) efflux system protein CusF
MKRLIPILIASTLALAACNQANETPAATAPAPVSTAPSAPAPMASPKTASATGVVQSIDAAAKTITIAHGPVESLGWPGMTMTFLAPGADLAAFKAGDNVSFEFTSTGMDGTIVALSKQ